MEDLVANWHMERKAATPLVLRVNDKKQFDMGKS